MDGSRRGGGYAGLAEEQSIDLPRYRSALRRGAWLIVLIVVPLTATVLLLSLTLPKTYAAEASLVLDDHGGVLAAANAETSAQRLATIERLLTSRDVLEQAAKELPGETADSLEEKVTAAVDDAASIVALRASDSDPEGAAAIANGVTQTYLDRRSQAERRRFASARRDLEAALERLRGTSGSRDEISAVRERLSELSLSELDSTDELQVAEAARPPEEPESPKPLQNTILAFCAALFLAVLAALARDFMAPRIGDARQFATLTGLRPLASMPASRRRRRDAEAAEGYQALAAAVRLQLSESRRVVLVTGASAGDDRAAVVAGLGRALTGSGVPTLLVSADLRHGALHDELDVPAAPGVGDVLDRLERDPDESAGDLISAATRAHERPERGELRVLPSGDTSHHPAALLSGEALGTMFEELTGSEYRYVVVEGPPLLGTIDGQLVSRWADAVLVVCRLDRLSPNDATELGDVVAQLEAPVLGAVLIGGTSVRYSLPHWSQTRPLAPVPHD